MSFGLISIERLEVLTPPTPLEPPPDITGKPSTTNNGWLFPEIEPEPLMVIKVEEPASPDELFINTPDVEPESELIKSAFGFLEISSPSTVCTL